MDKRSTNTRICPTCKHEIERGDLLYTKDCYGIPLRLVCFNCYEKLMANGYDGEHYTEADENIDYDQEEIINDK